MIPDEDVRQFFQGKLSMPAYYKGADSLQIFRGIPALLWKDQHSAGCFRHFTVFNNFGAIPKYCFDCCKVLIEPRTVVELFKLFMVFEKIKLPGDNTRKCMCESRDLCPGAYKGFIYCRGVEEARQVYDLARKAVAQDIAPEVPVSLKRGCSEFELAYPGYARIESGGVMMQYKKDWKVHEEFVDTNAVFSPPDVNNADNAPYGPAEIFAMHYWLSYAATIGDMSYLKVSGRAVPSIPQMKRPAFTITSP
jgi:hypothetical protein